MWSEEISPKEMTSELRLKDEYKLNRWEPNCFRQRGQHKQQPRDREMRGFFEDMGEGQSGWS